MLEKALEAMDEVGVPRKVTIGIGLAVAVTATLVTHGALIKGSIRREMKKKFVKKGNRDEE